MKIKLLTLLLVFSVFTFGQSDTYKSDLITLADFYRKNHFGDNPSKEALKKLNAISSPELNYIKDFIRELSKNNNNITTKKYLTKPDTITLRNLYIIRSINHNMFRDKPKDNMEVIDSLAKEKDNYYETLSCYYSLIFISVENKNNPFDMSDLDFTLSDYNLVNDTEKGIFFLESMERLGTLIWGYINIPNPPNYDKALEFINKYPSYNGEPYYKYTNLDIDDFLVKKDRDHPKESYKKYYLNKYMNTVLYHVLCLAQKPEYEDEKLDVLLNSILRNEMYWEYSENAEILDQIYNRR